jgi:oligosaccharyltransferase complex subunit delta (ribophorin II)
MCFANNLQLIRIGANFGNYPSGIAALYALGFQASLGAILALYALYWLQLNMMETLRYLLILLVPTFFFGVKTLNALSASKTKKD